MKISMAYHILMPLNQSSNQVATVTRHYRLRKYLSWSQKYPGTQKTLQS